MGNELLPCPFCGGEPIVYEIEPHTHVIATFMPDHPGSWVIECAACTIGIINEKREQVVATWNRRLDCGREGAIEALEHIKKIGCMNRGDDNMWCDGDNHSIYCPAGIALRALKTKPAV